MKTLIEKSVACGQKSARPWNKGKHLSEETKTKIREARARQVFPEGTGKKRIATRRERYGYVVSPESREKIRQKMLNGGSPWYRGGVSRENKILRNTAAYRNWRKAVFERDNYTCQKCHVRGVELHPHHIKSWEKYPQLRFEISNGKTLCIFCHKQTDTYAKNFR